MYRRLFTKKITEKLSAWRPTAKKTTKSTTDSDTTEATGTNADYFFKGNRWAYDVHLSAITRCNRYRIAFLTSMGLCTALVLLLTVLLPLKTFVPFILHQRDDGTAWVEVGDFKKGFAHSNAQIKSELYHYVKNREGYDATTFKLQTHEIKTLSSPAVYREYEENLSANDSVISVLGATGYRDAHVETIQFVQQAKSPSTKKGHQKSNTRINAPHNLAIITLTTTDKIYGGGIKKPKRWRVVVSWRYRGMPKDPQARFINWDGFEITDYQISPIVFEQTATE